MKLPNILTIFRILLIPVFIFLFFSDIDNNLLYAFFVFAIAGVTDVLDGYIARKYDMITDLGKVLDPLADKLMLLCVLFCLTTMSLIPMWILILMIVKEILMIYGAVRLYFSKTQVIIQSNYYGKLATVAFYLAITLVLLELKGLLPIIVLYFAVIVATIAFINYLKIALMTKSSENS